MIYLLDANVLIALTVRDHVFHTEARAWLDARSSRSATCPITQGALIRFFARAAGQHSVTTGKEVLRLLMARTDFVFWPDDVSYLDLPDRGLRGHKQVTDFYLVALTHAHEGRLATLDAALATQFPDTCELIR